MFLRFCVRGFGKKERNVLGVDFKDMPNWLTEHGSNQNVGIKQGISVACQLLRVPLLLAAGAPDLLVLPHELIFGRTPSRNHSVEFLRGRPHGLDFRFAVSLLRGNKEAERLSVASCERFSAFEVAGQVLTELSNADLFGFHIAYSVYTIDIFRAGSRSVWGRMFVECSCY